MELKDKTKGLQIASEATKAAIFDMIDTLEALAYSNSEIRSVIDAGPENSSADAIIKCRCADYKEVLTMIQALVVHCECKVLSYESNCDAFKSCVLNNAAPFAIRDSFCKMPRISCDDDLEPTKIEGEIEPLMSGRIWFNVWVADPVAAFKALDQIIRFAVHFGFNSDFRISGKISV